MSVFLYDRNRRSAVIATLSPGAFTTTGSLPSGSLSGWTHVVRCGDRLLFYDRGIRAGALARLREDGIDTLTNHPAGSFGVWSHIVAVAGGCFFYDAGTGSAAFATVDGRVTTTQSFAPGSFGRWTHVVADGERGSLLLFHNRLTGGAAVAVVTPTSVTTTKVHGPGELAEWSHVVSCGSEVLFYSRDTGAGVTATLHRDGFTATGSFPDGSFASWTHVVTDGTTVLFTDRDASQGAIGTLDRAGFRTTAAPVPTGEWTHVAGSSACGEERDDVRLEVLLAHWPADRPAGCLPASFYERYLFDLSFEHGIGRYWFIESGGALRLTGHVHDWTPLAAKPGSPGMVGRAAQARAAMTAAAAAGWSPRKVDVVLAVVAAPGADDVDGGATTKPQLHAGRSVYTAVIHGDSQEWLTSGEELGNFRFDFNAHEVGHLVGSQFSFDHAFGPGGAYDDPYCIMSAMSYGLEDSTQLESPPVYDPATWVVATQGEGVTDRRLEGVLAPGLRAALTGDDPPTLLETTTKGPGLGGVTRAACGWARAARVDDDQLDGHGVVVHLAHLGDEVTTDVQVLEYLVPGSDPVEVYAVEFRSPLAEHDQGYEPTVVVTRRGGNTWVTDTTWGPRSAIYVDAAPISRTDPLPAIQVGGLFHVQTLAVGPTETDTRDDDLRGPAWIRVRVGRTAPVGLDAVDPLLPVTRIHPPDWVPTALGALADQ